MKGSRAVSIRRTLIASFVSLAASCLATGCTTTPPAAAETLAFSDFFVRPVGPRGLEPTARLLGLDGKRVRIAGYVVEESEPSAGSFLLTPVPVTLAERADGPADFLPPATLFAQREGAQRGERARFTHGAWQLTGTLELGAFEESDGRVSYVRLWLDQAEPTQIPN